MLTFIKKALLIVTILFIVGGLFVVLNNHFKANNGMSLKDFFSNDKMSLDNAKTYYQWTDDMGNTVIQSQPPPDERPYISFKSDASLDESLGVYRNKKQQTSKNEQRLEAEKKRQQWQKRKAMVAKEVSPFCRNLVNKLFDMELMMAKSGKENDCYDYKKLRAQLVQNHCKLGVNDFLRFCH